MTVATWTTAPIPANALRPGDRIDVNGEDVTLTDVAEGRATVTLMTDQHTIEVPTRYLITVPVPDEPVDGYNLWKPKPAAFPSGYVCVMRRLYEVPGNWETVARDPDCGGHYDRHEED